MVSVLHGSCIESEVGAQPPDRVLTCIVSTGSRVRGSHTQRWSRRACPEAIGYLCQRCHFCLSVHAALDCVQCMSGLSTQEKKIADELNNSDPKTKL